MLPKYDSMKLDFSTSPNRLTLNFLELETPFNEVPIYAREIVGSEKRPGDRVYRFFDSSDKINKWASFVPRDGFSSTTSTLASASVGLGLKFISECLQDTSVAQSWQIHKTEHQFFDNEVSVVLENYPEGSRVMTLTPDFLGARKTFGLCVREHFRLHSGQMLTRSVLIREGALDASGRPNSKYHVEAWQRLLAFLNHDTQGFSSRKIEHGPTGIRLQFAHSLVAMPAPTLPKRIFLFKGGKESLSQYHGLRQHGPYALPAGKTHLLTYIGLEKDRSVARLLYNVLNKGCVQPDFDGLNQLFKTAFDLNPDAKFIPLNGFGSDQIDELVQRLRQVPNIDKTIAIVILPRSEKDDGYSRLKASLLSAGIVSQFCTRELVSANTSLKWSAANIALGIFAKAGGSPWHVKTDGEKSVIIGIAQSVDGTRDEAGKWHPTRHLAYSILTDSSGEFRQLDQLADVKGESDSVYGAEIGKSLRSIMRNEAKAAPLIALHCPFTLRRSVMEEIEIAVREVAEEFVGKCSFCVVKINQGEEHAWFGFAEDSNSLTPIESSVVRLGTHEFLVWFEGIDVDRRLAKKRYGPPTHVRFMGPEPDDSIVERVLTDLVDLAGANWRGFNARSEPVSIYYCKLVAKFLRNLHAHGVAAPPVKNLNPWFL